MVTPCLFDDKWVVFGNGIDQKPHALPVVAGENNVKFVLLDLRNVRVCKFLTGKPSCVRPFANSTFKKVMVNAIRRACVKELSADHDGGGNAEELEEFEDEGIAAAEDKLFTAWGARKNRPAMVEIDFPKLPGSETTRPMLVLTNTRKLHVECKDENIDWIAKYVRADLGLPTERVPNARKCRRLSAP